MTEDALQNLVAARVERLGYEFVELERAGSRARPILRVRIDRPGATPGHGVTLDDCTRVSRELETVLDDLEDLSDRYVLEVSSPGVERPLVRPRDYERFAGQEIAVLGHASLAGRGRRLEGELLGLGGPDGDTVRLQLDGGEVVDIPRAAIARAHLVFRWQDRA